MEPIRQRDRIKRGSVSSETAVADKPAQAEEYDHQHGHAH